MSQTLYWAPEIYHLTSLQQPYDTDNKAGQISPVSIDSIFSDTTKVLERQNLHTDQTSTVIISLHRFLNNKINC